MKTDVTFHPSWWYKNAGIHFSYEFFNDPEYRIDCDVKMRKVLYDRFGKYGLGEKNPAKRPLIGSDLIAAGYLHSEIFGCEIKYQDDNSPQVVCLELEDSTSIVKPDLKSNVIWKKTQKQIEYLQDKYGRVETYVNLMGIQNIAMDILGQNLFINYFTEPQEIDELLNKITQITLEIGKTFESLSSDVSGGVTSIIRKTNPDNYLTSNCSVELISNDTYEKFLLKYDQILADEFKNFGVHHCGQTMEHVIDGYSKIKGLSFIEVGAGGDMKIIREKLPNIFINARYSPVSLIDAGVDDIAKEIQSLVNNGKSNEGQLSISCVGIDALVSETKY